MAEILNDNDIAAIFAAHTAIIAVLVRELDKKGSMDKTKFVNAIYSLLGEHEAMRQNPKGAAPIKHLLNILDNG